MAAIARCVSRVRCCVPAVGSLRRVERPLSSGAYYAISADKGLAQPLLPAGSITDAVRYHDSLQYHFFFPGLFVAGRVFHTKTLQQHSAWMYEESSGKMTELFDPSYEPMVSSTGSLTLDSSAMHIADTPSGGTFEVKAAGLKVNFQQRRVLSWLPSGQDEDAVIHRPDMTCTTEVNGKVLQGVGYSKRYYGWYERFWGYRFIHGFAGPLGVATPEPERSYFWNADAAFGDNKYNYLKIIQPSGELLSANTVDTWQQDTSGYGLIGGVRHEFRLRPLCTWETIIGGAGHNMESKMQNRYCKVQLMVGDEVQEGVAYNERCYGTLG